jgi:O-antigen/teichoic acid export membrane protein
MFAMMGMSTYGVREIAACGANLTKKSKVFCELYITQLLFAAASSIIYLIYVFKMGQVDLSLGLIWALYVISSCFDVSWFLFGEGEFRYPTVVNSAIKLIEVFSILLFVRDSSDVWLYALIIAIGAFVSQVVLWFKVFSVVKISVPPLSRVLARVKPNIVLFIPVIAVSIYTSLDKIMLGLLVGMEQTGYFEYSERMAKFPLAVVVALGTAMLPHMTSKLASNKRDEALQTLESSLWIMMAVSIAFSFGIAAISPEFCPVFFGPGYDACIQLMITMAPIIIIISASNLIGRQYLIPCRMDKLFTVSLIVGALINFPINLILIPQWGAFGAAIGTVVAEVVVLAVQLIFVRNDLPLARYAVNTIPFLIIGIIMILIIRIASYVLGCFGFNQLLKLVLEILLGGISYSFLSILYCRLTHNIIAYRLFPRLFPAEV